MTKRTDPHRPSVINPADYEPLPWPNAFQDLGYPAATCYHCGHRIRYAAGYKHLPTGEHVVFGEECADLIDTENRISYEFKRLRKAAAEKRKQEKRNQEWIDRREAMEQDFPEVVEFMEITNWQAEKFTFLIDMKFAYDKWGSLTERQISAVEKIMAKRIQQAEAKLDEEEPVNDAPDGRTFAVGKVVSLKHQDGYYGSTLKMLVVLDDGNKVWGTVPQALVDATTPQWGWDEDKNEYFPIAPEYGTDIRGLWVKFNATFKRSDNDSHFSTFKRPGKVEIIGKDEN